MLNLKKMKFGRVTIWDMLVARDGGPGAIRADLCLAEHCDRLKLMKIELTII